MIHKHAHVQTLRNILIQLFLMHLDSFYDRDGSHLRQKISIH
jgi:hypothetical protein